MKVALVLLGFHKELGGYGSHVYNYARELSKKHDVTVLSSTYSPAGLMKPGLRREGGVKVLRFKSIVKGITPGLFNHLRNSSYDIVHVYGYQSFQPLICLLAVKGKPLIFTPFYHPFGEHNIILRKLFDLFVGSYSIRKSDLIIAQSSVEKEFLERKGAHNVVIKPMPINELPVRGPSLFRKKFKLGNARVILSVGRLSPEKRFDELLKIFARLDLKNTKLVIAGGGDAAPLKSLVKELGLSNRVVITGFLSSDLLASAYSAASLFVLVSKYESFGLVFAEAMSRGVPCVGLRRGGVPFVVGNAGIIVKDLDQVGPAIKKVIFSKSLQQRLSKLALKRSKFFSKKVFMADLLKIYKGLLK